MKTQLSKSEIQEKINEVFLKKADKKEIEKIKKLASSKNIKLGEYKKRFCKKCLSLFNSDNCEIRIKKGFKIVKCKNCKFISKYKLK